MSSGRLESRRYGRVLDRVKGFGDEDGDDDGDEEEEWGAAVEWEKETARAGKPAPSVQFLQWLWYSSCD